MIAHDFVANPWPRDECDAKVSDDGRNARQCGRPAREHAKPKTAEERVKELEEEIAALRRGAAQAVRERDSAAALAIERDRLNTPLVLALREAALSFDNASRCLLAMETGTVTPRVALELIAAGLNVSADRARAAIPSESSPPVDGSTSHKPAIRQLEHVYPCCDEPFNFESGGGALPCPKHGTQPITRPREELARG